MVSQTAAATWRLKVCPAWLMNVMRPRDRPASSSSVTSATPMAMRSRVLRWSTAMTMPRIVRTRATTGMTHLSVTMRLKNPENFETCALETTVTPNLLPWVRIGLSGLNKVTPLAFASLMTLLSAGVTLTTIPPPFSSFSVSGVCLPVRTSTTASWVCRFKVSQSCPNLGLSNTLRARPYT